MRLGFALVFLLQDVPPQDEYFVIRINGSRAGYLRRTVRASGDTIVTVTHRETHLKRAGTVVHNVTDSTYEEKKDGTPVRFTERRLRSAQEVSFAGEMKDGKLVVNGKGIAWNPKWLWPAGVERLLRAKTKKGASFEYEEFTVDVEGAQTLSVTVVEESEGLRSTVVVNGDKNVSTTTWRAKDDRRLLKWSVKTGGIEMTTTRCSAEEAAKPVDAPEVFLNTLIPIRQKVGDVRKIGSALLRIAVKDGTIDPQAFAFEGQKVETSDSRSITLRVKPARDPADAGKLPIKEKSVAEFLKPNATLQSDHPKVIASARQAVGSETDPWKAAKRIERYVFEKIKNKGMGVAFGTAAEVAERWEGDCTEHAVVSAAMARVVGLPSRVVTGLVAAGEVFGAHMWTEVWVGRWVPIDATFGGEFVDATHIKLSDASLNASNGSSEFNKVLSYMGRITIDFVEYESGGKTIKP
jgi:transglutaminase-like putative cysteine protease